MENPDTMGLMGQSGQTAVTTLRVCPQHSGSIAGWRLAETLLETAVPRNTIGVKYILGIIAQETASSRNTELGGIARQLLEGIEEE